MKDLSCRDCAKYLIDYMYEIDHLNRISKLFYQNKNVKIKIEEDILPKGDWLSSVFITEASNVYIPNKENGDKRVFDDEYEIKVNGNITKCKLSTQWIGDEIDKSTRGRNYLKALIKLMDEYYSDSNVPKVKTNEFNKKKYDVYFEENENNVDKYLHDGLTVDNKKIISKKFDIYDLSNMPNFTILKRYIASLLAKPFVILTGNSGTGKTRIAKQFAEYLEVVDANGDKNWLIVPIGADWTDNMKILGFYNPLGDNGTGKYEKTAIVKLIERANKNDDIPYFLILDEMNLSHVERYFSDFLSHMETIDNSFELDGYKNDDNNQSNKLSYPKNLFVIGTVNIDETTYMFSPKVLDRANVIEFKPNKEDVLGLFEKEDTFEKINPAETGTAESFFKLAKEIREGKNKVKADQMEKVSNIFTKVYDITEKKGFEFAYRTVKEIKQYINAAYSLSKEWTETDLNRVIDEQLLQKVLPKIYGNRREIGSMLDELNELCKRHELVLSEKKIEQMKGKLADVQYASFI